MPFSMQGTAEGSGDIQALRRVIENLARQHRIDLTDRAVIGRIVDDDTTIIDTTGIDPQLFEEFSSMLRLLFRLEFSSSEDLGVSGLSRLWERHREILRRFGSTSRTQPAVPAVAC